MEHLISIIIPNYNGSRTIGKCLESIFAFNDDNWEVIVVDDGSTDDTEDLIVSFQSDKIRYVSQVHNGVSSARNTGIGIARGEWLAFLDSDDLWLPQKLVWQLSYLSLAPGLRICQTEEVWMRNGKQLNPKKYHRKPQGHCFPSLVDRCLVSPSAVVMHRSIFDTIGLFDETLPACEDYDMWLRIGCRYAIGLVEEKLTIKRGGHSDQLSAYIPCLDKYRIRALMKLLDTESLSHEYKKVALEALERKCIVFGKGCRKRGRITEAEKILSLPSKYASDSKPFHLNATLSPTTTGT